MSLELVEKDILNNKKQRDEFIDLPWSLYKNDPLWVPPIKLGLIDLLGPKHPFYQTSTLKSWMAYFDGKAVGRIAAIINSTHNQYHEESCGFFGFFEFNGDTSVADILIKKASDYLKSAGMSTIRGPVSPSTNYECGILVEGFDDSPQLMMTYNPKSYPEYFESKNFQKAQDLLAYDFEIAKDFPEIIYKVAERVEKSNRVSYRPINLKDWDHEIDLMLEIYNSAWEKNWGFIPMSEKEFKHMAKDMKSIVDPSFIIFAMVEDKEVGFIVTLPDYNQVFKKIPTGKLLPTGIFKILFGKKHINRIRTITLGIKPEFRKIGLASLLYKQAQDAAKKQPQFINAEMSWILESNKDMNKPLISMGAHPYKKYRIYEKEL